ncbi:MAG: hypothetical protein AB7G75_19595 [Candidatus Binatia bacterium]
MTELLTRMELTTPSPLTEPPPAVAERIRKQPEYALLWAVLENGLTSYMRYAAAKTRRGKRLFCEAEEWIKQEDTSWLCSFVNICYALGLDPEYLRRGLRRWRAKQPSLLLREAA